MNTNPADCDRATVYTGECRNFADTEWIRFDSGRRRSPDARDGNTWLIDVAYGSFWMADDQVRNLVPLVPAPTAGQWTRDDLPSVKRQVGRTSFVLDAVVDHLNAHHPKPESNVGDLTIHLMKRHEAERTCDELRSLIEGQKEHVSKSIEVRNRMRRERDEALRKKGEMVDRAVRAERERDEAVARATLAEQERENWRITAINRPAPAVSRADIEKIVADWVDDAPELVNEVWSLVSGSDPAAYVVRESDIAAFTVERSFDGRWFADDEFAGHENVTPEGKREQRDVVLRLAAKHEAVARAIEAEQDVDPAEELTDSLAGILYGDELVTDQMRGVLERVVRAGMLFPSEASSDE